MADIKEGEAITVRYGGGDELLQWMPNGCQCGSKECSQPFK
jgi:hypothetical protein